MGTFGADANGEVTSGMNHKGESTKAAPRDGTPGSSDEVGESRWSEGGVCSEATSGWANPQGEEPDLISYHVSWVTRNSDVQIEDQRRPLFSGLLRLRRTVLHKRAQPLFLKSAAPS